jgi:hypothetical protein
MIVLWIRRWLLLAVGLPVAAWLLERIGESIESSRGGSGLTRTLRSGAEKLREFRSGRRGRR